MPPQIYNSIPKSEFHNAVVKYYSYYNAFNWEKGSSTPTIEVFEIVRSGLYELHLSAILDPTGANVTKFHFTLRKGPGKGYDAFAWFAIIGHNKGAVLGPRVNQGMTALFNDASIPQEVAKEVGKINLHASEIFRLARTYIK